MRRSVVLRIEMNSRILRYHLREAVVLPVLPLYWLGRAMLYKSGDTFPRHHGIVIAQFGPKEDEDPLFVPRTMAALDFLAETDPRRLQRVQRFIKAIIFSNRGMARYNHILPGCFVGFAHYHFEEAAPHKVPWYACTLVHEATHGLFHARRIPYTKRTRERIEYWCVMEEWRFAQHFHHDGFDWKSHIWSKVANRAWDPVWHENPIHILRTILWPNAHGELDRKETESTTT